MKNPLALVLFATALVAALVITQRRGREAGVCSAPPLPLEAPASTPPPEAGTAFYPASEAVSAAAASRGRAIASEAFGLLSSNLLHAIATGGISNALGYCSLKALPLTESAASRHQVQLARITHRPRNLQHRADPAELTLLDTYRDELRRGNTPLRPVALTNVTGGVRFYSPIVITNPLCLNCHGTPGVELRPENLAVIRRLYPEDEAIGFKLGDLRGLWRIDFRLEDLLTRRE